jgi:hypothetical protein
MADIFVLAHARTSAGSRAAKAVKRSAVTPCSRALSVARTADHHSGGIRLREDHLRTAQLPAPTSEAIASSESQSSMIDVKEVKSDMGEIMGQLVPKIKAIVSHDYENARGHTVPMGQDDETVAETAWREAFCQRLRDIQGDRTDSQMATILGITRERWSKYLNRGSAVPIRLLPKMAATGVKSLEWLIEGPKDVAKKAAKPIDLPARRKRE